MHYFGGKQKAGKKLVDFMVDDNGFENEKTVFFEPFVGGCNIIRHLPTDYNSIVCSDSNEKVIALYNSLQSDTIELPDFVSEDEYNAMKQLKNENLSSYKAALVGFAGCACGYSGKWFSGYSRSNKSRNYALNAKNSLLKRIKDCQNFKRALFLPIRYDQITENGLQQSINEGLNCVVYCDPPYEGKVNGYKDTKFDHSAFWSFLKDLKGKHKDRVKIYVSSYTAPDSVKEVFSVETVTEIRTKQGREPRVERIFEVNENGQND